MANARRAARASRAAVFATAALVCACTVGPDYQPPALEVPEDWQDPAADEAAPLRAETIEAWWQQLGDPVLVELVERARLHSRDLAAALWRVEAARAARDVARGDWFPDVDAAAAYERSRASGNGPAALPVGAAGFGSAAENRNLTSVGLDASWEVDVFGRIRRAVEAAGAELDATAEDARDVQVIVLSEVASVYVEVLTFEERLHIAEANAAAQAATLDLTRSRRDAELAPDLDVAQAESNLALTRAEIPSLRAGLDDALHRLSFLLGGDPGLAREYVRNGAIPRPPALEGVGVPQDVLVRRPDVRAAERRLAAETARIGVATADLYPRFSLTGGYGYESLDGSATLDSESRSWFIGPGMRWNLFDGGRVRGVVRVQSALAEAARAEFEGTVLRAEQEIESALSAYRNERERADHLAQAARSAERAVEQVRVLYREGLTDFQNVLDAERTLFQAQDLWARSRGTAVLQWIRVYRALGGESASRA